MERDEEMTLQEAAARAKVKAVTLRKAISKKRLAARKIGPMWVVTASALKDWQINHRHKPGPAPKD